MNPDRKAFEKITKSLDIGCGLSLIRDSDDGYIWPAVTELWEIWQAAIAWERDRAEREKLAMNQTSIC